MMMMFCVWDVWKEIFEINFLFHQIYQPWVLRTYGDLSKSKTITLKKQSRILSALKGLESNRPDSSKFRFWVKSKGEN